MIMIHYYIIALFSATAAVVVSMKILPPARYSVANILSESHVEGISSNQEGAVIIGGGPAGLAAAIMLAKRGYENINVYEQSVELPKPNDLHNWGRFISDRSYILGLGGRGQKTLEFLGADERVKWYTKEVLGRIDWGPGAKAPVQTIYKDRSYNTHCIERDRLSSCLLEEIKEKYPAQVNTHYGVKCQNVEWINFGTPDEECIVSLVKDRVIKEVSTKLLLGTDGSHSVIREAFVRRDPMFQVAHFEDDNKRVYRSVPINFPLRWRSDINYSARSKSGILFDALPSKSGPYLGVVIYRPDNPDVKSIVSAQDARAFFNRELPMISPYISDEDCFSFAVKSDSNFPTFQYVSPILHVGRTACLLGDSIHTVKVSTSTLLHTTL